MHGYKSQVTHTQKEAWFILERVSDVQEVSAKQVMKHFQQAQKNVVSMADHDSCAVLLGLSKRFHPVAILTQTKGP